MLGRGVKRKWSCSEEAEGVTVFGTQRDEDQAQGESYLPHLQQRQLVLSLSLDKLQHGQTGVEPSLRRSVLLLNTLRQIQEDMQKEQACTGSLDLCVYSRSPDILMNTPDLLDALSDSVIDGAHQDSSPLRDNIREEDMPLTCPTCSEGEKLDVSSLPQSHVPVSASLSQDCWPGCSTVTHLCSLETANAMSYLTDLALDDIFEDIDTSMCDTSDLPNAWTVYPSWAGGVSSCGVEELQMYSSYTSASTLQLCLADLNDLDPIMKVLVNS